MLMQNPIFIPGPTNMPERVRRAIDLPSLDHRSARFGDMLGPTLDGVKQILKTEEGDVIVFPASGTGGWEAAITNTLCPGDRVLVARYGMFSHRWIDLCQRHKLDVQIVDCAWGMGAPADRFEEILRADRDCRIKAVLATHNETATGVLSDMAAVRAALDAADHPALFMVDGVSSIASVDFRMDAWGVDVAVTGSQKGFMLPAGLAIVGVSKKAQAAMANAECPRCFFDFRDMLTTNASGGYPYTPAVALMAGLRESVDMLLEEGLDVVFARHHRIAEGVRQAVHAWGLDICARSPTLYSDTVTAVVVPDGFDGNAVVSHAADAYDVAFGVGLGDVAGKVFRIGHLGAMTDVMALSGLAAAEMVMADLEMPVTPGAGVAAAQAYYRATRAGAVVERKAA
ncbi:MAG: L-aspartate--glyoxylate aminotransferase BhcA [Pseudomonadota bacterium]